MRLVLPSGDTWGIEDAARKLALRATLPGARLYDLAAQALRAARARGVSAADRFALALPASWLVNNPVPSTALRAWAIEPARAQWLAILEELEHADATDDERDEALGMIANALGASAVEPASKVLAVLVPHVIPLMPPAARGFVVGEASRDAPDVFARVASWFARAARDHEPELAAIAREHTDVELEPAQVLDRLLWFDSEGHRHFARP